MSDSNKAPKSNCPSGMSNKEYITILGGQPPKKEVKEIDKQNSTSGRKRAPGSVRV